MTDRPRLSALVWAFLCAGLFGLMATLVTRDRSPLDRVDTLGRRAEDWADGHAVLIDVLRGVELLFGTIGMSVLTALAALLLVLRGHRRAAVFTVVVMVATSLATTGLKLWLARGRPDWQDATGLITSKSFPSGHASSAAAYAGILIVLAVIFIRRSNMRRLAVSVSLVSWLVICLDRVLLGRHYPSDVVGGSLLGAAILLVGLVAVDPWPRGHAAKIEALVDAVPSARRLAVVLNPVKVEDPGQFRSVVETMAAESGWGEPRWHLTTIEDPGSGMAASASVDGADLVIVCGGDGTVREVCAELAGTGIPVGIVPAGTGNLLARNLGIPLYLRSAIDVALNGQDRAIDLVEVRGDDIEDTHFMVMAGMGMDAAIMEGVNEDIKKRVGWFAYVLSALRSSMIPAVRIDISVDNAPFTRHRARTVVVGNVGYLQAGMPLLPDASLDDGLLDVVILHPRSFLAWVPLAVRVVSKRSRIDDTINRMTGARVHLKAVSDTPRQLDGDSVGAGRELVMECIHGRLLVRVPR